MDFFNNPLTFHDSDKGPVRRFVSAEIEVNDIDDEIEEELEECLNDWKCSVVEDGSVDGFEINTAPAKGEAFIKQISEICSILKKGSKLGNNCSMHIHIDARDFTGPDLVKLAALWQQAEPKMSELVASNRRTNSYCKTIGDALAKGINLRKDHPDIAFLKLVNNIHNRNDSYGYEKATISDIIYSFGDKDGANRYRSLNLHSWFYRKTIENRMLECTLDVNKIINWANINANILSYAKEKSFEEISKVKLVTLKRFIK